MPLPEGTKPLTVSALTNAVKLRVEENFPGVWVTGEVANLVRAASGHIYFTLKDAGATLKCAMFRGFALRLRFDPKDGMSVNARGGITVYPPRGEYQLVVEELLPKGVGAAELALRQLKEKLLAKGYFDPKRKKPLPRFPRRIALVASATGAAIRDMLEILTTRWPLADVVVRPSRVQGAGAAEDVAASVRLLNRLHRLNHLPLDAIVIGRGGGSSEDLAAFNEEIVADAIHDSTVPVVSAVGHEIDVSVADLVADYRALTPSQAITALTPDRRELMDGLADFTDRLREAVVHRVELGRQRVDQLAARPALRKPLERVRELEQKLDDTAARLLRAANLSVRRSGDQLAATAERLEGLSPLNVLRRGYSLTRTADGDQLIRDASTVRPGDRIVTRLAGGEILSEVVRSEVVKSSSHQVIKSEDTDPSPD
ncbi:exodeoxyribonuclease VII large subunit [Fimbriiglobus ruber]|uniref:Exodeoxyribonuclease 7 large subunit n=1 Tax=Fimbriiglobus ruber TaxID=1908690 RepID=A0A225DVA8_9BACT|nr:exodeoxyribonuclease VII large subunit [Fimbriiglobus ruber]OWK45291.1 Exodeoxyribonuclease VII large subunit [Fimbriiglobus ruber]